MKNVELYVDRKVPLVQRRSLLPFTVLVGMVCAVLLIDAVLPLRGLWFSDALLTQLGSWPLLPTQALFPMWAVTPGLSVPMSRGYPSVALSWLEVPLLLGALLLIFLLYLAALRRLPAHISRRYILGSTLLLGGICILIPVATSPDIFSYIAYARIGGVYHLNPLTTLPTTILNDPIYPYLYWTDQPSAYGPTWAAITCLLQGITTIFGSTNILATLLALRLLGLATHLGSTWLIWLIGGILQRDKGYISPEQRLRATLAFAWNPLLLFEACVNAHNDSSLLFLVLLAIWFLAHNTRVTRAYLLTGATLAIATCLKLNVALLFPGLLLFLWTQPQGLQKVAKAAGAYCGTIVLLYAPFWQDGAILNVFHDNPSTSRNINSIAEFAGQLYNSIAGMFDLPLAASIGSPAEHFTHTLSTGIFVIIYGLLCFKALRKPQRINTLPGLIRWLALAWLLYCAIGSPWFWPWYIVTFFGLYALIEATGDNTRWFFGFFRLRFFGFFRLSLTIHLLAFSMLGLYCFYIWGIHASFIAWLPGFQWPYIRGLWAWLLPLLSIRLYRSPRTRQGFSRLTRDLVSIKLPVRLSFRDK